MMITSLALYALLGGAVTMLENYEFIGGGTCGVDEG